MLVIWFFYGWKINRWIKVPNDLNIFTVFLPNVIESSEAEDDKIKQKKQRRWINIYASFNEWMSYENLN